MEGERRCDVCREYGDCVREREDTRPDIGCEDGLKRFWLGIGAGITCN